MTAVRFGRYRLVHRLGVGGTAEIWRAVVSGSRGVEHRVIIKRLRPELARDPVFIEMLAAEARISSRLDHPAIVDYVAHGETYLNDRGTQMQNYAARKGWSQTEARKWLISNLESRAQDPHDEAA